MDTQVIFGIVLIVAVVVGFFLGKNKHKAPIAPPTAQDMANIQKTQEILKNQGPGVTKP